MEAFLEQSGADDSVRSPDSIGPAPRRAGARATRLTRTSRLAAVAFVFAALGTFTPGNLGLDAGLLTAELGISLVAILLAAASLERSS